MVTELSGSLRIAIAGLKLTAERYPDYSERVDAVMREARNHWLLTDDEEQFKAACGALLLVATDDERDEITSQLRVLAALSSALSGVPVDWEQLAQQSGPARENTVMLRDRFLAAKGGER